MHSLNKEEAGMIFQLLNTDFMGNIEGPAMVALPVWDGKIHILGVERIESGYVVTCLCDVNFHDEQFWVKRAVEFSISNDLKIEDYRLATQDNPFCSHITGECADFESVN